MAEAVGGTVEAVGAGFAEATVRETSGDAGAAIIGGVSRIGSKPKCY